MLDPCFSTRKKKALDTRTCTEAAGHWAALMLLRQQLRVLQKPAEMLTRCVDGGFWMWEKDRRLGRERRAKERFVCCASSL